MYAPAWGIHSSHLPGEVDRVPFVFPMFQKNGFGTKRRWRGGRGGVWGGAHLQVEYDGCEVSGERLHRALACSSPAYAVAPLETQARQADLFHDREQAPRLLAGLAVVHVHCLHAFLPPFVIVEVAERVPKRQLREGQ